jgi:hypothetical protein
MSYGRNNVWPTMKGNALTGRVLATLVIVILPALNSSKAGPPFLTDDPEPVEYRHWEVYVASQLASVLFTK